MADRARFEICTKKHRNNTPHGTIILPDGNESHHACSQARAKEFLEVGISSGHLAEENRAAVLADIEASGLPLELTDRDFQAKTMEVLTQLADDLRALSANSADQVTRGRRRAPIKANFEVVMPMTMMSEMGCYPVLLLRDGVLIAVAEASNAKEGRDIVNQWMLHFKIPRRTARALRTMVVNTTAKCNAQLAALRAAASN